MNYEKLLNSKGRKDKELHKRLCLEGNKDIDYAKCLRVLTLKIIFEDDEIVKETQRLYSIMKQEAGTSDKKVILFLARVFCVWESTIREWVL